VDRDTILSALDDLVLSDYIVDQLGPALISQRSLFLYGGTGNGKTSIAERLYRLHCDAVVIPYALEVDGQIIILYDPVVHERLDVAVPGLDQRWVVCKRPSIVVGGELVSSMLDLRKDSGSGTYAAPVQLKANNGVFIIDDFGRQMISPRDLLNRWIVPLDRRTDHLALDYGIKFEVPFELLVVFSTNLEPSQLADECFLRRIPNKIYVESLDAKHFDEIFRRVANSRSLVWDNATLRRLRELCLAKTGELRACFPRDICDILSAIMVYERRDARINREDLERAVALYFPDEGQKRRLD
jgi:SpoVK/Ycf46/Vps4 family AAA+-type ATPase